MAMRSTGLTDQPFTKGEWMAARRAGLMSKAHEPTIPRIELSGCEDIHSHINTLLHFTHFTHCDQLPLTVCATLSIDNNSSATSITDSDDSTISSTAADNSGT